MLLVYRRQRPQGLPGEPDSGLTDVTTTRGFELAFVDTNVQHDILPGVSAPLETGSTDDFGILVQAGRVRAGSSVVTGEFIFLSLTGGLQGADIDTVDVPPTANQTVMIYVDLDPLDSVLGVETVTQSWLVDGSGGGRINIIEAFSLNVDGTTPIPVP